MIAQFVVQVFVHFVQLPKECCKGFCTFGKLLWSMMWYEILVEGV